MTTRTGRPIGKNVRDCCAIVEAIGPCTYLQVAEKLDSDHNSSKYLQRAVDFGLMSIHVKPKGLAKGNPSIYTVIPGWRDRWTTANSTPKLRVKSTKAVRASPWSNVNSVFSIGAQA